MSPPPPDARSRTPSPSRPDGLRPPLYAASVNRNLITRMGTASGVVAALVAAVFAVLVTAVRDQRSSTDAARKSQQVITAASQARQDLISIDLGNRGNLSAAPDVAAAQRDL